MLKFVFHESSHHDVHQNNLVKNHFCSLLIQFYIFYMLKHKSVGSRNGKYPIMEVQHSVK